MKAEFLCPQCGADDTASFSSIYAAGTKAVSMGGIGIAGDGDIGLAGGLGRSQTALAASTAPPQRRAAFSGVVLLCGGLVLVLVALIEAVDPTRSDWTMVTFCGLPGIGVTALGVYVLRTGMRFNRTEYPVLYAAWNKRWLCRRCGKVFVPDLSIAAVPVFAGAESGGVQSAVPASHPTLAIEHVICNMCGASLRAPATGGRFKCPKCQALVVA